MEKTKNSLIYSLKNEAQNLEKINTLKNFKCQAEFDKFYNKLAIIHDKELYLALKSKESFFALIYKSYNEMKSIYMLNYNRRLALTIQIEAFRLAVKSQR